MVRLAGELAIDKVQDSLGASEILYQQRENNEKLCSQIMKIKSEDILFRPSAQVLRHCKQIYRAQPHVAVLAKSRSTVVSRAKSGDLLSHYQSIKPLGYHMLGIGDQHFDLQRANRS